MSAQINLYHQRFLKTRDWLTLGNVAIAAVALYALLAVAGGWAWRNAAAGKAAAAAAETHVNAVKMQVEAATQAAAVRKPNVQLAAELAAAEATLRRREEIARLLDGGVIDTSGFAEYLRGFARAVPNGLWLTGFSIAAGGSAMEIRGSMLNAAALPEYIRRLGSERIFQGRSFASLVMNRPEPLTAPTQPMTGVPQGDLLRGVSPAPSGSGLLNPSLNKAFPAQPIDFVLLPKLAATTETGEARP